MKDIVLITNYWHFEVEKASSRYLTLANMISSNNVKLEVITSSFYHASKRQRNYSKEFLETFNYKVKLIYESGYKSNISIKRILSHREFAKNVLKYIKKRERPDLIYCVVPSLDVAYYITSFAEKENLKIIIDIQDLWPEAFKMAINIPVIKDILFYPMKNKAKKIYSKSDVVVAVSNSYVNHALKYSKKVSKGVSVYLGIEFDKFDEFVKLGINLSKEKDEFWVGYVGTLSHSYDLVSVIDALEILYKRGYKKIKFLVIGDGPLKDMFENYSLKKNINIEFKGNLLYSKMVSYLSKFDIAVNPIVKNSVASIINKHADYLAAGLPIVNTQNSNEFRDLLVRYNAGLNCENGNAQDLAEKILLLYKNRNLRITMGENSRELAKLKFNRLKSYKKIVDLVVNA